MSAWDAAWHTRSRLVAGQQSRNFLWKHPQSHREGTVKTESLDNTVTAFKLN
ncbi:MAG: hypothetical protein Q8J61_08310 [Sulfuricella sp.]|nr:hypothetical protein [Sulfuricella sp.]